MADRRSQDEPQDEHNDSASAARASSAENPSANTPETGKPRLRAPGMKKRSAEARRLAEREEFSGEIRTPADISARRARRSDKPQPGSQPRRVPVSAGTMVPERTFSGRIIVLTIVTLVVISFLVPTVRSFFQQRSELNELQAQISEETQRQDELYSELGRWEDPEFVRQQARERVNLVMPGERRYQVLGEPGESEGLPENQADTEVRTDLPWAEALWDSLLRSAAEEPVQ